MTTPPIDQLFVVMLDDDPEDIYSMRRAFRMCPVPPRFESVTSAAALLHILEVGVNTDSEEVVFPDVVLLDLNLPVRSGFDVLATLRKGPTPNMVPVVVLSTSDSPADCLRSYREGANAFFTKPAAFMDTQRVAASIAQFWGTPGLKTAARRRLDASER